MAALVQPGTKALTRMSSRASSTASARAIATRALLAAAYCVENAMPSLTDTLLVNTIEPPEPWLFIWAATARTVKNAPSRFTDITRRHSWAVSVSMLVGCGPTPALAKQESMRPNCSRVASSPAATASSSLTSTTNDPTGASPRPVSSAAAVSFLAALVPQMTTAAPALRSPRAIPSPIPPLPPVTTATWPVRSCHALTARSCPGRSATA